MPRIARFFSKYTAKQKKGIQKIFYRKEITVNIRKIVITILVIIILAICGFEIYIQVLKKLYPLTYSEYVSKYSEEYGIDEKWIFSLIKAESNFEPSSVSQSGAVRSHATYGNNSRRSRK